MYQHTRLTNNSFGFFQKFKNFDYILLVCILLLGFISLKPQCTQPMAVKFCFIPKVILQN